MAAYNPHFKRTLDLFLASFSILVLSPLFFFVIIFICLDSGQPVFFRQKRIGKHFKPFNLIKFRSMKEDKSAVRKQFDPGDVRMITRIGKLLRKTKLDELPELFNILMGDMSVVGPRPEVEKYVRFYQGKYNGVLKVRPGLSDFASIKYRDEEEILTSQADPARYYMEKILPDKLQLARDYVQNVSIKTDMEIIINTIKSIIGIKIDKYS